MTAAVACRECGSPVYTEDRFCGTCGAPQAASLGGTPAAGSTERAAKLLAELRALTAGEYEVRGEIGRGGMAVVYLAYDLRLNRKVAIKAMLPDLAFHDGMEERFKREARTAARLDHPNIVVIYSVRDSGDPLFFVMKYVDGAPLDAVIRSHGALPIPVVQGLLLQLCVALQYAHGEGVVHRDVKPANILIDTRGNVQVTDFGIAKAADSSQLTRTGTTIGTPTYMCPEQCLGHPQSPASDQYSMGIVAYELLTGRPPFEGTGVSTQWAHISDAPAPVGELRPDCPPALASAVMRMLAKDPDERWPALRDALPSIAEGIPPDADAGRPGLAELVRRSPPTRPAFAVTPPSPVPHRVERRVGPAIAAAPRTPAPRTPVPRAEIVSLEVEPRRCTVEMGTSERMRCRLLDADGKEVSGTPAWSSSDPEIASVDDAGVVSAHAAGTVTIAAMVDVLAAMARVEVVPASVARVDVEPSIVSVPEHGSVRLAVRAFTGKGKQLPVDTVTFRCADPSVATLGADGTLTGVAPGRTTAVASVGGVTASIIITVTPAVAATLGIAPAGATVPAGETLVLVATVADARGHPIEGRAVKWRSSAPSVAKVDPIGRVTARRAGTATIVATSEGFEARAELTVTAVSGKRIPSSTRIPVRAMMGLAAIAAAGLATWAVIKQSDDGPRVASAVSSGTVATLPAPPVAPTATPPAAAPAPTPAPAPAPGQASTPAPVAAAVPVPVDTTVASIELADQSPVAMDAGEVKMLIASAANQRGDTIPTARIDWESSNPAVATVDADGVLSAVAAGRTLVTARVGERTRILAVDVRPAAPGRDSVPVGDSTPASPSVVVEAGLPAGVRAPSESEARAIADSVVAMIGRGVVRVSQLVRADPEPGARFQQFLDSLTPTARLAGTPVVSDVQATGARVAFDVVLAWEATPTTNRERTVNLQSVLETVRGGWVIRELRFPNGFTTQPPR